MTALFMILTLQQMPSFDRLVSDSIKRDLTFEMYCNHKVEAIKLKSRPIPVPKTSTTDIKDDKKVKSKNK